MDLDKWRDSVIYQPKWRQVEFETLPMAASNDDIHKLMKQGRWRGTPSTKSALELSFSAAHIEQFNFGKLSLQTIRDAQAEALDFIEFGCMALPYDHCIYRCSIEFDNQTVGFHLFNVATPKDGGRIVTINTLHNKNEAFSFRSDNTLKVGHKPFLGRGLEIKIPKDDIAYWEHIIGPINSDVVWNEGNGSIITEGCTICMGLTMILNTKGIRKERSEPSDKPNKARMKKGLPLLPRVTRIYTDVYNRAVAPGTGTHASPRPHRRRAHVRHYPATDFRAAYVKPIAAMLVNWDGKPLPERNEYEVHYGKED